MYRRGNHPRNHVSLDVVLTVRLSSLNASPLLVRLQHLLGVLQRRVGQLGAADHARQLAGPFFGIELAAPRSWFYRQTPSSRSGSAGRQTTRSAAGG